MIKRIGIIFFILMLSVSFLGCSGKNASQGNDDGSIKAAYENGTTATDSIKGEGEATHDDTNADTDSNQKVSSKKQQSEKDNKQETSQTSAGRYSQAEPQESGTNKKKIYHATVSITCKSILDNINRFDKSKIEVLPKDGVISGPITVEFYEGESAFDVLLRATRQNKIHMEFVTTPVYNSSYVEGINNIYEFDAGELSGWMYKINDFFPNYGSSRYILKDGDKVQWIYTCDLGRDIGGDWAAQKNSRGD